MDKMKKSLAVLIALCMSMCMLAAYGQSGSFRRR